MSKILIALGHGPSRTGAWDPGATGNGTTEASWLRGDFLKSLKKYADSSIDFYEQNMFANRDAAKVSGYSEIVELHLDAAAASVSGGHIIIHTTKRPDDMDNRLGAVIDKNFGLRGGRMFDHRSNLLNLNVFNNRKIAYRLLELGFITNKANMDHFKANYDQIAKELIYAILNKKVVNQPTQASTSTNAKTFSKLSNTDKYKEIANATNVYHLQNLLMGAGERLPRWGADGKPGAETLSAIQAFQVRHNISSPAGDNFGRPGPATMRKLREIVAYQGTRRADRSGYPRGNDVRAVQLALGGLTPDSVYGPKTTAKVKRYQKDNNLIEDGILGPQTWSHLFG